jgi:hypothetical protein
MSEILTLVGLGAGFSVAVLAIVAWTIFWKGWSLWIAARKGEFWWFIAMLVVNTFGILEIIYIFVIKKMKFNFTTKRFEERPDVKEVNKPQSAPSQSQD